MADKKVLTQLPLQCQAGVVVGQTLQKSRGGKSLRNVKSECFFLDKSDGLVESWVES